MHQYRLLLVGALIGICSNLVVMAAIPEGAYRVLTPEGQLSAVVSYMGPPVMVDPDLVLELRFEGVNGPILACSLLTTQPAGKLSFAISPNGASGDFTKIRELQITVDDQKTAIPGEGFTTDKSPAADSPYSSYHIPLPLLERMATAKNVVIMAGPRKWEMKPEHKEALKLYLRIYAEIRSGKSMLDAISSATTRPAGK